MSDRQKKDIFELTRITCSDYRRLAKLPVVVLADNIRSLQNVGSLMRTCDAFLIEGIILGGITGTPPHPEITKTALGAEDSVAWRHVADSLAEAESLQRQGWKIYALEQTHGSIPLQQFVPRRGERYVIVAGNEVEGVDQRIVDLADGCLEIPQAGTKHSLNVAVSGAIALWHFYSSLHLAGAGEK